MIQFYNSLTKEKTPFEPIEKGKVKIYTCGVTVYDYCHLGHARGAVNFDLLRRFLEVRGYEVTFVKNYTDIDDKIIARAQERGVDYQQLTQEMIAAHDEDMAALGVKPPDIAPKATEHMGEILEMINCLQGKGLAYQQGPDVFYKVRSFESYGKLSGKNIDDLLSGSRVEVNETKEDALDFALWKGAKPGEPKWESPWGQGRPGWHIECSAMAKKYLGPRFDIHAGGSDLIFPHHENEIAQSEGCHGEPLANFWLHNGMVKIDAHKMSKSLGNFFTIRDLLKTYEPELIRFFLLSAQYRAALNFSEAALAAQLEGLDRLYGALAKSCEGGIPPDPDDFGPEALSLEHRFFEALDDDLNSSLAISVLFEAAKSINLGGLKEDGYWLLRELGEVLGLLQQDPESWFKNPRIRKESGGELSAEQIEQMIAGRAQARIDKNWAEADRLRDALVAGGIQLIDKDGKTEWRRK
ncbi:MAG: cysteine--tRNA ligase [bacterium]|nr:cysteine--tRNA ligase [bacterium]